MKVFRKTIVLRFRSVFPDDSIVQNILFICKLINIGFRLRYLIRDVNMLVVDDKVHASVLKAYRFCEIVRVDVDGSVDAPPVLSARISIFPPQPDAWHTSITHIVIGQLSA